MKLEQFKEDIIRWMEEHTGYSYRVRDVIKNNDEHFLGISRNMEGSGMQIAPTIYLNDLYENVASGQMTFAAAATIIETQYQEAMKSIPVQVEDVTNFEQVKGSIFAKLVNLRSNAEYLADMPYKVIANDLALTYRWASEIDERGIASAAVSNKMMETWGIEKETLHEIAMKNTPDLFPLKIQNMLDIVMENVPEEMKAMIAEELPEKDAMYVLTNTAGINGATAILYPDVDKKIKDILQEDVYILPSSIHECILIRKSFGPKEVVTAMVREANASAVLPQDYLSDNVYELAGNELVNLNIQEYENNQDFDLDFMEMDDGFEPEM